MLKTLKTEVNNVHSLWFYRKILREVYGDMPSDDSVITPNLVNVWLNEGIGLAVKKNQSENIQLEGFHL